jgi:hypothetical protein
MKTFLFTVSLTLVAQPCLGMFCDNGVVAEGDTQMEVLKRCGDPDYVTNPDYRYVGSRGSHVNVKRTTVVDWIYNFGPMRFIYTVTFEGGRVVRIEAGDYGW